jgi:hypothetical protein
VTDCAGLQYDWRLRLSRLNMTDFDLAKYDWRRRECGGGSGDYCGGEQGNNMKGKQRKGKPCIKSHKSVRFHVVVGAEPLVRSQ